MTPDDDIDSPSLRKPVGVFLIIAIIAVWVWAATSVIDWLNDSVGPLPTIVTIMLYAVAGIVWILPLRPILIWMETGRWRHDPDQP